MTRDCSILFYFNYLKQSINAATLSELPRNNRHFEGESLQKSLQWFGVNPFVETVFYCYTGSVSDSEPFT